MRAATTVGYRPSMAARTTRTGRSGLIGMVASPVLSFSVTQPTFMSGLARTLHASGLCLVSDVLDEPGCDGDEPASGVPQIIREHLADGLLINYAFGMSRDTARVLERADVPIVWINQLREANCVRPDDAGAAAEATRHLIGRGCRDIAFVAGITSERGSEHFSRGERERGYRSAMVAAGLTPRVEPMPPLPPMENHADRLGHVARSHLAFLCRADRPEAVLCESDGRVMLLAAARAGLRVPEDLSVFGIDNEPGGDVHIAMSRVVVPYFAMGRAAAEEILALVRDPGRPPTAGRPAVRVSVRWHGPLGAESSTPQRRLHVSPPIINCFIPPYAVRLLPAADDCPSRRPRARNRHPPGSDPPPVPLLLKDSSCLSSHPPRVGPPLHPPRVAPASP